VTILFYSGIIAGTLGLWRLSRMAADDDAAEPMTLADDGFDLTVERYDLMVVDFWAPWCGPCIVMAPVIDELAEEYAGKVIFGKLNTDENPATTERFAVMGIPTLLFLQGGTEVERIVGAVPKQEIKSVLDRLLEPI
jgi:thioredoxin 1